MIFLLLSLTLRRYLCPLCLSFCGDQKKTLLTKTDRPKDRLTDRPKSRNPVYLSWLLPLSNNSAPSLHYPLPQQLQPSGLLPDFSPLLLLLNRPFSTAQTLAAQTITAQIFTAPSQQQLGERDCRPEGSPQDPQQACWSPLGRDPSTDNSSSPPYPIWTVTSRWDYILYLVYKPILSSCIPPYYVYTCIDRRVRKRRSPKLVHSRKGVLTGSVSLYRRAPGNLSSIHSPVVYTCNYLYSIP